MPKFCLSIVEQRCKNKNEPELLDGMESGGIEKRRKEREMKSR